MHTLLTRHLLNICKESSMCKGKKNYKISYRSSRSQMFVKIGVLKFNRKTPVSESLFNTSNFIKLTPAQVFSS